MHLPPLAAGVALLVVGPRLLSGWVPPPARAIWLALIAVSPLLIYHSKIARPYALTSLLTFVAIVLFRAWWRGGRRRDAATYVLATFAAGWLHPITLPFTLLPFVYYGARTALRRAWSDVRRLVMLGLVTAALLALALLPPLVIDWANLAGKAGRDAVTIESGYRTLLLLAGTRFPLVAAIVGAAALAGLKHLLRTDRDLAWYLATIIGVGSLVILSSGAEWISHPLVPARYLIPALPFVLLLAALGMSTWLEALRQQGLASAVGGLMVSGLFVAGPIPAELHYPNQFYGHLRYQFDYDDAHNPYVQLVPDEPIPAFYRALASRPRGSVTLIEAPWRLESHFNPQSLYQDVHHQLIKIGLVTPVCGSYDFGEYPEERSGMKMRELVHLSSILRGERHGADYLIVHLAPRNMAVDPGPDWRDIRPCLPSIEAQLGPPSYRDEQIAVFDLTRLPRVSPLGNSHRTVQQ